MVYSGGAITTDLSSVTQEANEGVTRRLITFNSFDEAINCQIPKGVCVKPLDIDTLDKEEKRDLRMTVVVLDSVFFNAIDTNGFLPAFLMLAKAKEARTRDFLADTNTLVGEESRLLLDKLCDQRGPFTLAGIIMNQGVWMHLNYPDRNSDGYEKSYEVFKGALRTHLGKCIESNNLLTQIRNTFQGRETTFTRLVKKISSDSAQNISFDEAATWARLYLYERLLDGRINLTAGISPRDFIIDGFIKDSIMDLFMTVFSKFDGKAFKETLELEFPYLNAVSDDKFESDIRAAFMFAIDRAESSNQLLSGFCTLVRHLAAGELSRKAMEVIDYDKLMNEHYKYPHLAYTEAQKGFIAAKVAATR